MIMLVVPFECFKCFLLLKKGRSKSSSSDLLRWMSVRSGDTANQSALPNGNPFPYSIDDWSFEVCLMLLL